jgi:DNA repair protein RecN (Recombination protein N)
MLCRVSIQNIALIDAMELDFGQGLNILTGETGAGKSIIVDALGLVRGVRPKRLLTGGKGASARVEAVFDVSQNEAARERMAALGIEDDDGMLILSRQINANGKSLCKANAQMITLAALRQLGDTLADIHGQHEQQAVFDAGSQMSMLDRFGGAQIKEAKDAVREKYHRYKELTRRLSELYGDPGEREKRADFLRFQLKEIKAVKPDEKEETELLAVRERMQNAEQIVDALNEAYALLYEGGDGGPAALEATDRARGLMGRIQGFDGAYAAVAEKLNNAYYMLEEIAFDIRDLRAGFEFDPDILEQTQARLDQLSRLKRKYGGTIASVLEFYESARAELDALDTGADRREQMEKELNALETALYKDCVALHKARKAAAQRLGALVREELSELGLKNARFDIALEELPASLTEGARLSEDGLDRIEFRISPNPGQQLMPLSRIVSGGEASRIMLALKTIVAELDDIGTLVFDEIDTGLSGRIAHVVAHKLGKIARDRQVLCITHLPQIAAMADAHWLIEKTDDTKRTSVHVRRLDADQGIREIARLSGAGGEVTDAALDHARQMKDGADAFKKQIK